MKGFSAELDPLLAVLAAVLDPAGRLLEANQGGLRIVAESGVGGDAPIGAQVAAFFIQPDWASLSALVPPPGGDGLVYQGLMTVGDRRHRTRTLRGRVWRGADGIRVLAEYDIVELERVGQSFMDLGWQALQSESELGRSNWRMRQREASIVEASLTDALTGAGNRRQLEQWCEVEISRARRGAALSVFMVDLDFFKRVNDVHGHAAGDRVLVRFAALVREQIRLTDLLARYGGEEFVVLMPGTRLAEAVQVAERIRAVLAGDIIAPLPAPVTASFGVTQLRQSDDATTFIERADRALYQAKHGGRNQVVAAAEEAEGDAASPATPASDTVAGAPPG